MRVVGIQPKEMAGIVPAERLMVPGLLKPFKEC